MIIINQSKDIIINFGNVDYIKVRKLQGNEVGYAIDIDTLTNNWDRFALYETEERAKEILQDIVRFYIRTEDVNKVYKMPEE